MGTSLLSEVGYIMGLIGFAEVGVGGLSIWESRRVTFSFLS